MSETGGAMKPLGSFLRYLLNINTIWAVMILTGFVLCVVQHYLPVTTLIPADRLHPGNNEVVIGVRGVDAKTVTPHTFNVTLGPGGLEIPADDRQPQKDKPYLLSAEPRAGGYALKWDYDGYGRYELKVNGTLIKKGPLATLKGFNDTVIEYATKAFNIALGLVATMVLFLGLMKVGEDAGIVQLAARLLHPLIRFLYPGIPKNHPAGGAILMNMTTTILGLGNASTPFGLKAIKELQSLNKHPDVATDEQVMLIAYNTAGLALIPTTLLAVRKSAGCSDPFEIIGTCLVTGAVSTIVAIIMAKLLGKLPFFSVRAAIAEEAGPKAAADQVEAGPETELALAGEKEEQP